MTSEKFEVSMDAAASSCTLIVRERLLETADAEAFETACTKLLDTGQKQVSIDMLVVQSIPSVIIGETAKTKVIASEAGRQFKLVTNAKIAALFRMILQDLIEVEEK